MRLNKITIISILLLTIFTIGAVSAADDNVTDSTDEVLSANPVVESVGEEINESSASFSDLASLVENASAGDTLYLENDYVNENSTDCIVISKAITIDGQNHTLDANRSSNIFNVTNVNVILKNINFINSRGISAVNGKCSIYNCTFVNCESRYSNGGAVYKADAYNCTFVDCQAFSSSYEETIAYGGAIAYGSSSDCTFIRCDSRRGGAVYGGRGVFNCTFINCSGNRYGGGAVYKSSVYDSFFTNCASFYGQRIGLEYCTYGHGGAILEGDAHNCTFDACYSQNGGSIYNGDAYDCTFKNCPVKFVYAGCAGYAIYGGSAYNCSFIDSGELSGTSAIYNGDATDCCFVNCKGSAICHQGQGTNCTFVNCSAYDLWYIFRDSNALNCTFINCSGNIVDGDAIDCIFVDCSPIYDTYYGYKIGVAVHYGNAYNCSFVNCSDYDDYGVVGYGNAYNCSFVNCSNNIVGVIYRGNATGCSFTDCSADNGGAINTGNAYNCSFVRCYATGDGCAIYNGNAFDSIFIDCSSENKSIIANGYHNNCIFIELPIFLYSENMTVNYGDGKVVPVRVIDAEGNTIDGLNIFVEIYKGNNLINTFSCLSGDDLRIDATPGNYTISMSGEYLDPVNISLVINKGSPNLEITPLFVKSGETANIKVTLSRSATGNVRIMVNGQTYRAKITSGEASVEIADLADGLYEVTATYGGNVYFNPESVSSSFNVGKSSQGIVISVDDISVGETATVSVNMSMEATGFVRILVAGNTYKVKIEDGMANVSISNLKAGSYGVIVKYGGNYRYFAEEAFSGFEVSRSSPGISISVSDIHVGDTATVSVDLASDVPGNVRISVADKTYVAKITKGKASVNITDLKEGSYDVLVKYGGNYKYIASSASSSFNVEKGSPGISVSVDNVFCGDNATIRVNMASDVPGNVKIMVGDTLYKAKITNGQAILDVGGLEFGDYDISVSYAGNYKYKAQTVSATLSVNKIDPNIFIYAETQGKNTVITATISQNASGDMEIAVDGASYTSEIINGIAKVTVSNLAQGSHEITASYAGNSMFNAKTADATITV